MTDSDEEDFLLAALEQLEKEETSTPAHSEFLSSTNYESTGISSDNVNTETFSSEKYLVPDKNTNFRASLLKSLKNSQSNKVFVKPENGHNVFTSKGAFKRKLDTKESNEFETNRDVENKELISPVKGYNEGKQIEPLGFTNHNFISAHKNTNVKKRKFPGPAGLLPEMNQNIVKGNISMLETSDFSKEENDQTICSQTTAQDFESGPWEEMCLDLSLLTDVNKFFKNFNIKNLSRKNLLRSQASIRKVSCIAIMVRNLDLSHQDATAVFCDQTGEIQGTISADVIEKYGVLIFTGTVFVLKDATVLSPPIFQSGMGVLGQLKKHYLTITLNSIITIYSSNEDDGSVNRVKVLTLMKAEFEALLSPVDDEDKERKELIENEENELRVNLFENIGFEKNKNSPLVIKHSGSNSNFKSPFSNAKTKNLSNITSRPKPRELNLPLEKSSVAHDKYVASNKKFTFNSVNNVPNLPSDISNSSNIKNQPILKFESSNIFCNNKGAELFNTNGQSNIQNISATFADSLSDDDELDSLLASIDTDTL